MVWLGLTLDPALATFNAAAFSSFSSNSLPSRPDPRVVVLVQPSPKTDTGDADLLAASPTCSASLA